jgi:hypothetical protein
MQPSYLREVATVLVTDSWWVLAIYLDFLANGSDTGIPSLEMQKTEENPLKPTVCGHFPQCPAVTRSQS